VAAPDSDGEAIKAHVEEGLIDPKFLESLKIDSKYQLASNNLATTYNNYGLTLRERPKEAIKKFHLAFCLAPISKIALLNIEGIIRALEMDPNSFNDRIILAEQAAAIGDLAGSVIEYQTALQIKNDPAQRHKLIDALKRLQDVSDQLPLKLFRPSESEKALAREPIDSDGDWRQDFAEQQLSLCRRHPQWSPLVYTEGLRVAVSRAVLG
jgi:hypothetical protein